MQFYDRAADVVRAYYDRRIDTPATLDTDRYFPEASRFTGAYPAIRREALAVLDTLHRVPRFHDLMPQQADISAGDGRDWRMFILKAYGVAVEENLQRCPTLDALLAETPDVVSCVVSFLAPRKHIPAHRGPFRGILRFHLMLSMPLADDGLPACELNIDGVPYRLADGDTLLWDDTYPHEVWNRSDEVRIALLLDIWRKDMPADAALVSAALMAATRAWIRKRGMSYGG
ncbi:aspartyl/asparaginyl beta-hydroxylase domain-containing protein [Pseudolabrys taiwanensis]|uniref:Aspartyl/asparaginyl beta-hydroxylase domain-containing protein n=1 Tax=Pseudolabrys taiwanensis TaxID=331696 RepID=A0A345ZRT4_9HYPH|nr:aspartyl/asparaginyl beta-hydroxylase domain-containing protein [Pseudolabrys taiwanensis]AXK79631.1 aspartyl/asparaginyl beta-hydroxylase domain-containing protein [Pseudolabrys taiwanensis]